jgi:ankyrin repeat protein
MGCCIEKAIYSPQVAARAVQVAPSSVNNDGKDCIQLLDVKVVEYKDPPPLIYLKCKEKLKPDGFLTCLYSMTGDLPALTRDLSYIDEKGQTALMCALVNGMNVAAMRLLDYKCLPHHVDPNGITALTLACKKHAPDVAIELIRMGVDVNVVSVVTRESILSWAVFTRKVRVVHALLDCGRLINIDKRDYTGSNALMYACQKGLPVIAMRLLPITCDINSAFGEDAYWRILRLDTPKFKSMIKVIYKLIKCDYNEESLGDFNTMYKSVTDVNERNNLFILIRSKQHVRQKWGIYKQAKRYFPSPLSFIICDYVY